MRTILSLNGSCACSEASRSPQKDAQSLPCASSRRRKAGTRNGFAGEYTWTRRLRPCIRDHAVITDGVDQHGHHSFTQLASQPPLFIRNLAIFPHSRSRSDADPTEIAGDACEQSRGPATFGPSTAISRVMPAIPGVSVRDALKGRGHFRQRLNFAHALGMTISTCTAVLMPHLQTFHTATCLLPSQRGTGTTDAVLRRP